MTRLLNWLRNARTEVRLDDLELGDGDKLVLLFPGYLSKQHAEKLKADMEKALQEDGKKVLVLEGNPRLQVVRKFSTLNRFMQQAESA